MDCFSVTNTSGQKLPCLLSHHLHYGPVHPHARIKVNNTPWPFKGAQQVLKGVLSHPGHFPRLSPWSPAKPTSATWMPSLVSHQHGTHSALRSINSPDSPLSWQMQWLCGEVLRHRTRAGLEFLARVTVRAGSTFQLLPTIPPGPSLHQENCLLFYP